MKRSQSMLLPPLPMTAFTCLHKNQLDKLWTEYLAPNTYNLDASEPPIAMTFLCEAAFHRRTDVVKMLLDAGASIEQCCPYRFNKEYFPPNFLAPPLFFAIEGGNVNMVKLMIERGANPNVMLNDSIPLLYYLLTRDNYDHCQLLDMVMRFISVGVNINEPVRNSTGHSIFTPRVPLLYALTERMLEIAKLFVQHGADVTMRDSNELSSIYILLAALCRGPEARASQITLLKLCLDRFPEEAVRVPEYRYVQNHETALHLAAKSNHAVLVQQLLSLGCNAHVQDSVGDTPLDDACAFRVARGGSEVEVIAKFEIIKQFVSLGVPVGARVHLVPAIKKYWNIVLFLVSSGANVNGTIAKHHLEYSMSDCDDCEWPGEHRCTSFASYVREGDTALILAILDNNVPVVMSLINLGADVNARTAEGFTPLHVACGGRKSVNQRQFVECIGVKMVLTLLRSGANVNAECGVAPSLLTPLGVVTMYYTGHASTFAEVVNLLIRCEANTFTSQHDGTLVWASALKLGCKEVAYTLLQHGVALRDAGMCLRVAQDRHLGEVVRWVMAHGNIHDLASVSRMTAYGAVSQYFPRERRIVAAHGRSLQAPSFLPKMKWDNM